MFCIDDEECDESYFILSSYMVDNSMKILNCKYCKFSMFLTYSTNCVGCFICERLDDCEDVYLSINIKSSSFLYNSRNVLNSKIYSYNKVRENQ